MIKAFPKIASLLRAQQHRLDTSYSICMLVLLVRLLRSPKLVYACEALYKSLGVTFVRFPKVCFQQKKDFVGDLLCLLQAHRFAKQALGESCMPLGEAANNAGSTPSCVRGMHSLERPSIVVLGILCHFPLRSHVQRHDVFPRAVLHVVCNT